MATVATRGGAERNDAMFNAGDVAATLPRLMRATEMLPGTRTDRFPVLADALTTCLHRYDR